MIAGPGLVYVCHSCVPTLAEVMAGGLDSPQINGQSIRLVPAEDRGECSFCTKPRKSVQAIAIGEGATICNECIDLCDEIINTA